MQWNNSWVSRRSAIRSMSAVAAAAAFAPLTALAASNEEVAYRSAKWRTAHFKQATDAKQHMAMLKKLGCEVKQHRHSDHYDVQYRCPDWRRIRAKSHSEAHKLEAWLKHYGFETKHQH